MAVDAGRCRWAPQEPAPGVPTQRCRAPAVHAPDCLPACQPACLPACLPAWLPPPSAAGPGRVAEAAQEDPGKALWRKPRPSPVPGLLQAAPGLAPRPPPLASRTASHRTAPHRTAPRRAAHWEEGGSERGASGRPCLLGPPPLAGLSAPPPQSQGEPGQPPPPPLPGLSLPSAHLMQGHTGGPSAPREHHQPGPAALAGPRATPGTLGMRAPGREEVRDPGSPGLWRNLSLGSRCPARSWVLVSTHPAPTLQSPGASPRTRPHRTPPPLPCGCSVGKGAKPGRGFQPGQWDLAWCGKRGAASGPLVKCRGVCGLGGRGVAGRGQARPGQAAEPAREGLREQRPGCVWPPEPRSPGGEGHTEGGGRGGGRQRRGQGGQRQQAEGKSLQHPVFPGGLPSKY